MCDDFRCLIWILLKASLPVSSLVLGSLATLDGLLMLVKLVVAFHYCTAPPRPLLGCWLLGPADSKMADHRPCASPQGVSVRSIYFVPPLQKDKSSPCTTVPPCFLVVTRHQKEPVVDVGDRSRCYHHNVAEKGLYTS